MVNLVAKQFRYVEEITSNTYVLKFNSTNSYELYENGTSIISNIYTQNLHPNGYDYIELVSLLPMLPNYCRYNIFTNIKGKYLLFSNYNDIVFIEI